MNPQTPSLKLISHQLCPYVQRSIIALSEKQIPHEREYIDLANKPDWFLALSPLNKVPILLADGEVLFESAVICEYLDEITPGSLHPADALLKAKHRSWIEFGSNILTKIAAFYSAKDEESFAAKRQDLITSFQILEAQLHATPYFAGESFSLIDTVYGPIFRYFVAFELPKIGEVKARLHRVFDGKLKTVTVSLSKTGKYYASLLFDDGLPEPETSSQGKAIGVDVGLTHFAIASDGSKFDNPKPLKKREKNLKRKQQQLSRKQKGSKRRAKARRIVARVHERIANTRKDFQHKLSRKLVNENQVILVENLAVKTMVKNHSLAKAISDCGWSELPGS